MLFTTNNITVYTTLFQYWRVIIHVVNRWIESTFLYPAPLTPLTPLAP